MSAFLSEELLAAIAEYVRALIKAEKGVSLVYGTFVQSETADTNLSQINIPGITETQRGIRKSASVSGLVPGDTVLIAAGNKTMTILCKVVGNITIDL